MNSFIISVNIELDSFDNSVVCPKLYLYVFGLSGELLNKFETTIVKENLLKTEFIIESIDEPSVIKIAPDIEEVDLLDNLFPYTKKILIFDSSLNTNIRIDKIVWSKWVLCPFNICGKVFKNSVNGLIPIGYGEIEVFEIDIKSQIELFDDQIIEKIRDSILDITIDPPFIIENTNCFKDKNNNICNDLKKFDNDLNMKENRLNRLTNVRQRVNEYLSSLSSIERVKWLNSEIFEEVRVSKILYSTSKQFKRLLIEKFESFRYSLCSYEWILKIWWDNGIRIKLDNIFINQDGSFSKSFYIPYSRENVVHLYFKVTQNVNGNKNIIYNPELIPENIFWGTLSGDDTTIITNNLSAIANYGDVDIIYDKDLFVLPLSIGNFSLKHIYGLGAGNLVSDSHKNGLYESVETKLGSNLSIFKDVSFGGLLGIRVKFSSGLIESGVKYYRIKARIGAKHEWISLSHEIQRHFTNYDVNLKSIEILPYHIGPKIVGNENLLYEIKPFYPPNILVDPTAMWVVLDDKLDLISAMFDSSNIMNDYVDFKIELFDAAGCRVNPAIYQGGIDFKLPTSKYLYGNINYINAEAVNNELIRLDPENSTFVTSIFRLWIRNEKLKGSLNVKHCGMNLLKGNYIKDSSDDSTLDLECYLEKDEDNYYKIEIFDCNNKNIIFINEGIGLGQKSFKISSKELFGVYKAILTIYSKTFDGFERIEKDVVKEESFAVLN